MKVAIVQIYAIILYNLTFPFFMVLSSMVPGIMCLMATWFRNSQAKEDVVYVGPMGCLTGMYIIMTGNYSIEDMRKLTIECLEWILTTNR